MTNERYVQLVKGGHFFYADKDVKDKLVPDLWYTSYDVHNGPGCILCGDSWCEYCEEDRMEEQCDEVNAEGQIPGLTYDDLH